MRTRFDYNLLDVFFISNRQREPEKFTFLPPADGGNPERTLFGLPLTAATKKVLFFASCR